MSARQVGWFLVRLLVLLGAVTGLLVLAAGTGSGAQRPAGPNCQPVTFIMDSGNGAQVSGHMCGGMRRHPVGGWLIYVDGVTITGLSPNFLMFARHVR